MELQEIRRIVELMNEHGLTLFDLTKKDFHLKLKKGADLDDLRGLLASLPAAARRRSRAAAAAAPAAAAAAAAPVAEGAEITSPMVGTFYRKPAPGRPGLRRGRLHRLRRPDPLHHRGHEGHERDQGREIRHHLRPRRRRRHPRPIRRRPLPHQVISLLLITAH